MLQQKLIEGRYLRLPMFNNRPPMPFQDGDFVSIPDQPYQIEQSTGFFSLQRTSDVVQGTNDQKEWRNFRWLPWLGGAVSQVTLAGGDVLTGPMSGCWLVVYSQGGREYVGHIGTVDAPTNPKSVAVKAGWSAFAARNDVQIFGGFNPARSLRNLPVPQGDDVAANIYGLVTSDREFYTVVLWKQRANDSWRIGAIEQVPSAPLGSLRDLT